MSELHLKENPTLKDFQKYIAHMIEERGFANTSVPELMMLFLEEAGEMAKAVRAGMKFQMDESKVNTDNLGHEMADVLMYMLDIANKFDIDLEQAFREKEELNSKRTWGSRNHD